MSARSPIVLEARRDCKIDRGFLDVMPMLFGKLSVPPYGAWISRLSRWLICGRS